MIKRTKKEVDRIRNSREYRDRVRPTQLDQFPLCQKCLILKPARIKPATQVDHKIPLEEGGDPFDPENLQSLCTRCHVIKSAEESRQRHKRKMAQDWADIKESIVETYLKAKSNKNENV